MFSEGTLGLGSKRVADGKRALREASPNALCLISLRVPDLKPSSILTTFQHMAVSDHWMSLGSRLFNAGTTSPRGEA